MKGNTTPSAASDHAVAVAVRTPKGFPLVCDPKKPEPRFWKFPGGRSEPGETPLETAVRELEEETGIRVAPEKFTLVHQEVRGNNGREHRIFFFKTDLPQAPRMKKLGEGGEMVRLFTTAEIKNLPGLFPNHRILAELAVFSE